MRKLLIITILALLSTYSFSQSFNDKKVEIQNEALKTKISEYIKYVKKWAVPKKDVRNYLIALDQQTLGENTIFTLRTILFSSMINCLSRRLEIGSFSFVLISQVIPSPFNGRG